MNILAIESCMLVHRGVHGWRTSLVNSPVCRCHVGVDILPRKDAHAHPADVRTAFASHMITPFCLLNPNFALRALLEARLHG